MSAIEWTGVTWNPTTGCDRISPGCDHCYALAMARRLKAMGSAKYQTDGDPRTSGPGFGLAMHEAALSIPLRVRAPRLWFVNSMSDLGHASVTAPFLARVWGVMAATQRHTYQTLTKRPPRLRTLLNSPAFRDLVQAEVDGDLPWPLPNVWVGTSIELDNYVRRASHLRATPAAVRFLSIEPLLGPLPSLDLAGIDWVILGGESGPGARPVDLGWFRDIIGQARDTGTAVFVKQLGAVLAADGGKGGDMDRWPADLRIREYPATVAA